MSKKLKPLTIFLSDDELVNFKSHFDEFLNMNCDDKIKEQKEEIERLNNIIKDIEDYINFLVIYNQTISGKFSETQWGQDILGLIGSDK